MSPIGERLKYFSKCFSTTLVLFVYNLFSGKLFLCAQRKLIPKMLHFSLDLVWSSVLRKSKNRFRQVVRMTWPQNRFRRAWGRLKTGFDRLTLSDGEHLPILTALIRWAQTDRGKFNFGRQPQYIQREQFSILEVVSIQSDTGICLQVMIVLVWP